MRVPLVIIHFRLGFSATNHPFRATLIYGLLQMELQFGKIIEAVESPACYVDWAQELPSQHKDLRVSRPAESQWTAEEEERRTSRCHQC